MVTGGGGYVGSLLVPKLLADGHEVTVLDLFMYGTDVFDQVIFDPSLRIVKGDLRDISMVRNALTNCDTVIHLACISNDPSFELNPKLGKSINLDAFEPLVKASIKCKISKFIYASSSSVYGIKKEKNVTEDMSLEPLTDYSKFKGECENILNSYSSEDFITTTIRPSTVCGYAKRQRLDLVVNILTNHAFHKRSITVFGGQQLRPNIHIDDMVDSYISVLNADHNKINGEIFNVGFKNQSVNELAEDVKKMVGEDVKIINSKSDDNRSYHVSSKKISDILNFNTKFTVRDAVSDLQSAFKKKLLMDTFLDEKYFNIKRMQSINLT